MPMFSFCVVFLFCFVLRESFCGLYCPKVFVFLACGGIWHSEHHSFVWKLLNAICKVSFIYSFMVYHNRCSISTHSVVSLSLLVCSSANHCMRLHPMWVWGQSVWITVGDCTLCFIALWKCVGVKRQSECVPFFYIIVTARQSDKCLLFAGGWSCK